MKINKIISRCITSLAVGCCAVSAWSEDIDLYVSSSANGTAPNVLIYLDNTSNWSSAAQGWNKADVLNKCGTDSECIGYVNAIFGGNTSLTQGQVEVGALKLVINSIACASDNPLSINVGLLILPSSKGTYANDSGSLIDSSGVGGVIKRAIYPLVKNGTSCTNLIGDFDTWYTNITASGGKADSSANYGGGFFEAFKYFGGYTNPAGTPGNSAGSPIGHVSFGTAPYSILANNSFIFDNSAVTNGTSTDSVYISPVTSANSCGNNYILLVGNTWPNSDNTTLLRNNLAYPYLESNYPFSTGSQPRISDAWANFLSTTDVSATDGRQPVYTYAINVYNGKPNSDQTTLLKSIAEHGGGGAGGYFEVNGDIGALVRAFRDFFSTIVAKNSVFASSSLPVSANAQGTYLNQVFIGMFRPDVDGYERWVGNLKQYRFGLRPTVPASLYLADSTTTNGLPTPAIDNTSTGFIKPCVVSYWTSDTAAYWSNVPTGQTPSNSCVDLNGNPVPPSTSLYSDLQDGSLVEKGGAAQWLRSLTCSTSKIVGNTGTYCGRNIKTCATTSCSTVVDFNPVNITSLNATLVNWIAGGNLGDGPASSGNYQFYNIINSDLAGKTRPTVHGDVVHGRPLALNYSSGSTTDAEADIVVFYGAGDGMLHAVSGSVNEQGRELWAFVAPEFFPKFNRLRENLPQISYPGFIGKPKDYFFDGGIGAYQHRDATTNDLTASYIYPSMRRGGRMIYGFNATTKPSGTSPPVLMWKFGCPNSSDDNNCIVPAGSMDSASSDVKRIGQTWSTPRVIRTKGDSNLYVVFGGGYDSCEDTDPTSATMCSSGKSGLVSGLDPKGSGIYVLNAVTGAQVAYLDLNSFRADAGRVVADVVPVDVNYDGYTDTLYAVDTRGYVWRVNVSDISSAGQGTHPSTWNQKTYPIASVSDWTSSSQYRKLMYAPDVVTIGDTNVVLFGSGNQEQPVGTSAAVTTVKNRFYGLRDRYALEPSSVINGNDCDSPGDTLLDASCDLLNVTAQNLDYSGAVLKSKGWVLDLTAGASWSSKEQVVTTPTTIGGAVYFNTFQPTPIGSTAGVCGGLGKSFGYKVDFLTGGKQQGTSDTSIWAEFTTSGIPPSPVAGVVSVDGKKVPFIIGGKPASGAGASTLEVGKVTIPIMTRRTKVYRYNKIDTK